jgi:hypothetical protein
MTAWRKKGEIFMDGQVCMITFHFWMDFLKFAFALFLFNR